MAQFWPKTLPTSDESSHCLDTGCAPEDLLGKVDAARSTNITELPSPVLLGTAPSSIPLTHTGMLFCPMDSPPQDLFFLAP